MPNPQEILATGVAHHRARKLPDAERCYREVLQIDPRQADALHLLGVLLFETARSDAALECFAAAIRLNPEFPEAHYNLGRTLSQLGQVDQAIASYRQAIRCRPTFSEAHYNLGNLLRDQQEHQEAITCFRQAIACNPRNGKAYTNLGHLLLKAGSVESIQCFERAVSLDPNSAIALVNLARAVREFGDLGRAQSYLDQATRKDENCIVVWKELGALRRDQSRPAESIQMYQRALQLSPTDAETVHNIGTAQITLGQFELAAESLRRAIELRPDFVEAYVNLGNALHELAQFDEAKASFRRAIDMRPDFAEAHFNLGVTHLLCGDFQRGWNEYAWRARSALEPADKPRWDGSALDGKTILLYPEQGMGDTIQFIRFAATLKDRGARVLFGCPAPLMRLLQSCCGIDLPLADRAPIPPFDCYSRLLDLPRLLGVDLANLPTMKPYVRASDELIQSWRTKLSHLNGFRIGITWQGNPKHKGDQMRSLPLQWFESLARIGGVQLISLQQGFGVDQLARADRNLSVYDPGLLEDFMDTAALMQNLDLVITVDSAVAHLAGALGLPTWVALPAVPDWRWLLDREDTPWYPGMRLFRQTIRGDWSPVFDRMSQALATQVIRDKRDIREET